MVKQVAIKSESGINSDDKMTLEKQTTAISKQKRGILKRKGFENNCSAEQLSKKAKTADNEPLGDKDELDKRSLFVNGFPSNATEEQIKALSEDIIRVDRRKKNFAILRFESEETVKQNYESLKGKQIMGNDIHVDFVGVKSSHNRTVNKLVLCVTRLPKEVTEDDLKTEFPNATHIHIEKKKNRKSYAFITFADENLAEDALKCSQNKDIKGNKVLVAFLFSSSSPRVQKKINARPAQNPQAVKSKNRAQVKKINGRPAQNPQALKPKNGVQVKKINDRPAQKPQAVKSKKKRPNKQEKAAMATATAKNLNSD